MHGLASGKTGPLFVSIEITPECFVQHAADIGVVITMEQARDEMQSYRHSAAVRRVEARDRAFAREGDHVAR